MSEPAANPFFPGPKFKPTSTTNLLSSEQLAADLQGVGKILANVPEASDNLFLLTHISEVIMKILSGKAKKGDAAAVNSLVEVAREATGWLLCVEPEGLKESASYVHSWPVLVTRSNFKDSTSKDDREIRDHLKQVGFLKKYKGAHGGPAARLARVFYRTVASVIVERRITPTRRVFHETDAVIQASFRLDPLFPITKKNAEEWWEALSPIVRDSAADLHWLNIKGPIEDWRDFKEFWQHVSVKMLRDDLQRAKVRDLIFRALGKAFKAIPAE